MLGIVLIILLGFLVYHYRPKKLAMETRYKNALMWSELGKECFIGQIIFLIGFSYFPLIFAVLNGVLQSWMEFNNILLSPFSFEPINIPTELFIFFPMIFAWLTHIKLIKPLSEEKAPNQKWFHLIGLFCIMSVVGLFSVVFIQNLVMGFFSAFGYGLILHQLLFGLPFFSILFIGALAIGIAGHELKKCGNFLSPTASLP